MELAVHQELMVNQGLQVQVEYQELQVQVVLMVYQELQVQVDCQGLMERQEQMV